MNQFVFSRFMISHFIKAVAFIFLFLSIFSSVQASPPRHYGEAKKIAKRIFADHRLTLYCGCSYDKHSQINLKSCGMQGLNYPTRARRMEFEHMMPMEEITRQFSCGREYACVNKKGKRYRGRQCCRKIDQKYRTIEAELFNLWPVVGSVNRARSSYQYIQWTVLEKKQLKPFDGCAIFIDKNKRRVEPRDEVKGTVARANLFIASHHQIPLSAPQKQLFKAWDKLFPPNDWELIWAKRVADVMDYENPFISKWVDRNKPSNSK